jgi:hypothetical protein
MKRRMNKNESRTQGCYGGESRNEKNIEWQEKLPFESILKRDRGA